MEFPATDKAVTSFSTPVRVSMRIRKRLAKCKTPSNVEEIEAKLRHATETEIVKQGTAEAPTHEEDLGQRFEAKLQAAHEKLLHY